MKCSKETVYRILRLNKIPKHNKGWNLSEEDKKTICNLYKDHHSAYSIANQFEVSNHTVSRIIFTNNIEKNSYAKMANPDLKEDYFENINTPEKAYWLGWLITDGCISNNKIQFDILQNDEYILHLLEQDLNVTNKVKVRPNGYAYFSLGSIKMCQDLAKYNITPQKTFTVSIPNNIDRKLYSHLIRGIFDGDGGISVYTRKNGKINYELSFTGNYQIIEKIKIFLEQELPTLKKKVIEKNGSVYRIRWSAKKDLFLLREYLYQNCTDHYLTRKYEKLFKLC